jgi:hypothetical protein
LLQDRLRGVRIRASHHADDDPSSVINHTSAPFMACSRARIHVPSLPGSDTI